MKRAQFTAMVNTPFAPGKIASEDTKEARMNKEQFQGKWRQMRGKINQQWGKLTDDELDQIEGNYDMFIGKIQEKYGNSREDIERRLDTMMAA
jgi:uncharacterized protein YjbJ (UPF0337 family)